VRRDLAIPLELYLRSGYRAGERKIVTDQPEKTLLTFQEFKRIIARELQVDEGRVVREASFMDDLSADSIQLVSLILRMEDLGIGIPLETAWEVETVGDAYRLYREQSDSKK
jgi:acyl carrier protein